VKTGLKLRCIGKNLVTHDVYRFHFPRFLVILPRFEPLGKFKAPVKQAPPAHVPPVADLHLYNDPLFQLPVKFRTWHYNSNCAYMGFHTRNAPAKGPKVPALQRYETVSPRSLWDLE
jgi:hypothetical protein